MTLIEVLIALMISVLGLMGTLSLLSTIFKGNGFSQRTTEASTLVQSKLEEFVSLQGVTVSPANPADNANCPTSGSPTSIPVPTADPRNPLTGLGVTDPAGAFQRSWSWCTTTDGLRRRVEVIVTWTDTSTGRTHSLSAARERAP